MQLKFILIYWLNVIFIQESCRSELGIDHNDESSSCFSQLAVQENSNSDNNHDDEADLMTSKEVI